MTIQRPSDVIPFQKPQDSIFAHLVTRRFSRVATFYILKWFPAVTPNILSLCSFTLALAGSLLFLHPLYGIRLVGVILLQFGFVLDCSDGEISRITNQHSAFGAWLDSTLDRFKELAMLGALTWTWYRYEQTELVVLLIGFGAMLGLQLVSYLREAKKSSWPTQRASEFFITRTMYIGTVDVTIFLVSFSVLVHLEILALWIFFVASVPMILRQLYSAYCLSRQYKNRTI